MHAAVRKKIEKSEWVHGTEQFFLFEMPRGASSVEKKIYVDGSRGKGLWAQRMFVRESEHCK
jgi:hypothetical protein